MSGNLDCSPRSGEAPNGALDLDSLNAKINALLPPQYQGCFEKVSPKSMGSAGLKFDSNSRVAWDQIWTHFCDLALAGGPPHRGTLLEAATPEEVEQEPAGYHLVSDEIVRGIRMTSGLVSTPAPEPGWLTVSCSSQEMAEWLKRAIMAENVFARSGEGGIQLPVGPTFRLSKEVKNVVVALAKTCHYWHDHLSSEQRSKARNLFDSPSTPRLLEPPSRPQVLERAAEYSELTERLTQAFKEELPLPVVKGKSLGWVGLKCQDEKMSAWFVRSSIAENVLARREEEIVFVPVPELKSDSDVAFSVVGRLVGLYHLWTDSLAG